MTPQNHDHHTPPRDRRLGIKHNISPSRERELAAKRRLWKIEQEELRRYEQLRQEHIERWKREKMSKRKSKHHSRERSSRSRGSRNSSRSRSHEPKPFTSSGSHPRETLPVDPAELKKSMDIVRNFLTSHKILDIVSQKEQGPGSSTAHPPPPKTEQGEPLPSTSRDKSRSKQSSGHDKKEHRPSRPRSPHRPSGKSSRPGSRSSRHSRSRSRTRSLCGRCGHRYNCTCTTRCSRCDHDKCTCRQSNKQGGDYTHSSPGKHGEYSGGSQPRPHGRRTSPRTQNTRAVRSQDKTVRSRPEQGASTSQAADQAAPTPQEPRPKKPGVEWPPKPVAIEIRDQIIVTERGGPLHLWLLAYHAGETVDAPPVEIPFLRDGWCMPRGNLADYLKDEKSVWVPLPLKYRPPYFPNQRGIRPPPPPHLNWRR